jgi:hypothetical protein
MFRGVDALVRKSAQKNALTSRVPIRCSRDTSLCMCGGQSCTCVAQPRMRLGGLSLKTIERPRSIPSSSIIVSALGLPFDGGYSKFMVSIEPCQSRTIAKAGQGNVELGHLRCMHWRRDVQPGRMSMEWGRTSSHILESIQDSHCCICTGIHKRLICSLIVT